jgi:acyl-CoA thioesterase
MEKIDSPYEELLGMYIVEKREGFCKIGLSYRKELTNPHGNFHGGAIASIVDTAAVQGLRTISPGGPYLTVDLEIRYRSPSNASQIYAEARPRNLKGKFFVSEVKVLDKDNKLIAEAKVKSFLPGFSSTPE